MGYYINGLISQLQAITKIVARPIQGATLEDAIALANFYAEYYDIDRLIHHSELDVQEDIQMLKSDVLTLKEAILVFFDKLTPGWSTSSVRRIADIYLNRLHRKAKRKEMQSENFQRQIDDYCTATELRFSQRKFDALHNRMFKAQKEAQQLYDFLRAEKKRLSEITDVKFIYVISATIQIYRCSNAIQEGIYIIEQQPNHTTRLLTTKNTTLVKAAELKDYILPALELKLWEMCESYKVFSKKTDKTSKDSTIPFIDFLCFINLRPTFVKFGVANRKKLYLGAIIWCCCKTMADSKIRRAWQKVLLEVSEIDQLYYNKRIYNFLDGESKKSEQFVDELLGLFKVEYPDIIFREEE